MDSIAKILLRKTRASDAGSGAAGGGAGEPAGGGLAPAKRTSRGAAAQVAVRGAKGAAKKPAVKKPAAKKPAARKTARGR